LHYYAAKKLAHLDNLTIELGGSVNFLKKFIPEHPRGSNALLYLDAHGLDQFPLAEEIDLAHRHLPRAVVVIDDFEVPTDPGYGYNDYGPGKRISLMLLQELRDECHIFFPTLPSEQETGERRGVAVLAQDKQAVRRLASIPQLRVATEADWIASRAVAVVAETFQEKILALHNLLKESEADRNARLDQIKILTTTLNESEADRNARLDQIQTLTAGLRDSLKAAETARINFGNHVEVLNRQLQASEAVRATRLEQNKALGKLLEESEFDRTERLRKIEQLGILLRTSEADSAARLEQVKVLGQLLKESESDRLERGQQIESLNRQLQASEIDRVARFEQIEALDKLLKESESDRLERGRQLEKFSVLLMTLETDRAARLELIVELEESLAQKRSIRIATLKSLRAILPAPALKFLREVRHRYRQKAGLDEAQ
jgi:hypothetical protein